MQISPTLTDAIGPIFQLRRGVGAPAKNFICSVELLNEICDEERFVKSPAGGTGLHQVRNLTGDGLFTAFHGEENWGLAHRILMPVLGNLAIKHMFDGRSIDLLPPVPLGPID